jgi:hypothetical protein
VDKTEEKRWFEAVMPADWVTAAVPTESPDFVCQDEQGPFLGVEVTELFLSQTDARLQKTPRYAVDILSSGNYRHRDDRTHLPVEEITFKRDEGDYTVPAIVRKPASLVVRVKTLVTTIEKKSGNLARYQEKAGAIDLLLIDRGGLFERAKFDQVASIVHDSEVRNAIQRSGFREIWLVINTDQKTASIPCRVNLFAEGIASFHTAMGTARKDNDCAVSIGDYLEMLGAYLTHQGFVGCRVMAGNDKYAVFCNGVGCFVLEKNWSLFPVTPRVTPQSKLGEEVLVFEPKASHPLFESVCRVSADYGCFVNIVETPSIQF